MRNKYLSYTDTRKTTPFESSEEAWFWYCLCESLKNERTHGYEAKTVRPCESSDIAIAVKRLLREGTIRPEHLKVLTKYGFEQVPPHPHFGDSLKICQLWREALSFLESLLRKKGIVYCL